MLAALIATAACVSDLAVPHSTWATGLADRQPVSQSSAIDQRSQSALEEAVAGSAGDYSLLSKKLKFDDKRGRGRGRLGLTEPTVSEEKLLAKRIKLDDKRGRGRTG